MSEPIPQDPQAQNASSLIPALLTIITAYAAYKAAQGQIQREWRALTIALDLPILVGQALLNIYNRTVVAMAAENGRSGDELLYASDYSLASGSLDAGYQTIADALIWMDEQPPERHVTKDYNDDGVLPTHNDPPLELAEMVAQAVQTTAKIHVGQAAGWGFKTWLSQQDQHVRYTHMALHGVKISLGEDFVTPVGVHMAYPGDPKAPIAERINCRCSLRVSRA